MKWGYLLLVMVAMLAYGVNRGIYVGSETVQEGTQTYKRCYYLFPSGVVAQRGMFVSDFCRLFHD